MLYPSVLHTSRCEVVLSAGRGNVNARARRLGSLAVLKDPVAPAECPTLDYPGCPMNL